MENQLNKKFIALIILCWLYSESVLAETIVLHKCWTPIVKNAYGDKIKNFKEYSKYQKKTFSRAKFQDYIIKVNIENSKIESQLLYESDDPFITSSMGNYSRYEITEKDEYLFLGKKVNTPNKGRMIAVDVDKKKAGTWTGDIKNFKFTVNCKMYKSSNSILKSILKKIN